MSFERHHIGDGSTKAIAWANANAPMVAHEIRNALGPVQYASKALRTALDPGVVGKEALVHIDAIDQGVSRIYRFIAELVSSVSPQPKRLPPFSVLEAIAEARKELAPSGIGSLVIETLPGFADPQCDGNRGRFELAMLGVLRDSLRTLGDEVRISIRVDARDSQQLRLTIEDDGPRVPEHSFEQVDIGRGLASLRAVVEDMRGEVRCTASERGGAKLEVMLPLAGVAP